MGEIKKTDVYILLFEEYTRAKGYSEGTIQKERSHLRTLFREIGKGTEITKEDVERLIENKLIGKWYRANLRKTFRRYREFLDWWESRGINDFREWLQRQGYSRWTVRDYVDMLRMPSGRRKGTEGERKRLKKALSAYRAFLRDWFSRR